MQFPTRIRRTAPALVVATLLGSGLVGLTPRASASAEWCFDDPQVLIDGHLVTILTGVQSDAATIHATVAAANITISVPQGVSTRVVYTSSMFMRENVTIVTDGDKWTPGKDVTIHVDVTFTQTAAALAASHPVDLATGLQISGDSGKTYLGQGHLHDNLDHDYALKKAKTTK